MIIRDRPAIGRVVAVALGFAVLAGLAGGCSLVPDRSAAADRITEQVRALPGVLSVDGRYANGMVEGHSYNIDIRMDERAELSQVLATVDTYYDGLTDAGFEGHSSRYQARLGDDLIQAFGNDRHRPRPTAEVRRWFELIDQTPGAVRWAFGPDPDTDLRSISVALPDDVGLADLLADLARDAADLADRRWIIRWHHLRVDLMGDYPPGRVITAVERLGAVGDWSVTFDPAADPTVTMAVWAPSPDTMEATARDHLPIIAEAGVPVRYTVRGNQVEPAVVLVGGCLRDGPELQRQLNAEFGRC